jgi:amidase
LAESALKAADLADRSAPEGPLHGVPFTIKENIDCLGSATTQGMPAMAEALPALDAPVVERMKATGAIPLARTNLPEMGLRIATDNPLRGRTNNPWGSTRTCGGSSGGEAASLATGMSPFGLGNDIGGSLRNPAYCCGITSLKPTAGRVPSAGSIPPVEMPLSFRLMMVNGPMVRSVADLRLGLSILAGQHPCDPFSVPAPLEGPPVDSKAALVTQLPNRSLPESSVNAIRKAGEILSSKGWSVYEVEAPEIAQINNIWGYILASDLAQMLPMLQPVMSSESIHLLEGLIEKYNPDKMPSLAVHMERDRLATLWSAFFQENPVVIGPVWTDLPFLHDADIDFETGLQTTLGRLEFITPASVGSSGGSVADGACRRLADRHSDICGALAGRPVS